MSKHNNNLSSSMSNRCLCGRYITIGEEKARGFIIGQYECPDCFHRRIRGPLSSEEYYKQFNIK